MNRKRKYYWRQQLRAAAIILSFLIAVVIVRYEFKAAFSGVIGGFFMLPVIVMIAETVWMMCRGCFVEGTVVDHVCEEDYYFPIVQFVDQSGSLHRESTNTGCGVRKPPVGSFVRLYYDPRGKSKCLIFSFIWTQWAIPLAFGIVGATIILVSLKTR